MIQAYLNLFQMYLQSATKVGISKPLAMLMGILYLKSQKSFDAPTEFFVKLHNDVIFVTYKILAKMGKKAVIWICE